MYITFYFEITGFKIFSFIVGTFFGRDFGKSHEIFPEMSTNVFYPGGGTQAFLWQGCSSENKFQLPKKIEWL